MNPPRHFFACSLLAWLFVGCGAGNFDLANASAFANYPPVVSVSIPALPGEDLAGACAFDLLLQQPGEAQKGVFVVYERSDAVAIFFDDSVRAAMQGIGFAVLYAHQCNSISTGDLQADASKGPARVLTAALAQLATRTSHAELATVPVVPFGFSSSAVLSLTLAAQLPKRVLAVVSLAAGGLTDLDSVAVTPATAAIPTLLLANAEDNLAGTSRSLRYFQRGRAFGAPWAFATQNNTAHCCSLSTRSIITTWVPAIVAASAGGRPPTTALPESSFAAFTCVPNATVDAMGEHDCAITAPALTPIAAAAPAGTFGWLPGKAAAAAWLAWVTNPVTN